ncbi:MAG TPA: hypothetical protein VFG59_02985 [Anaeromyxobacter sp.]|nr:hypothetical protein [Anaeromyxobacter sp.]
MSDLARRYLCIAALMVAGLLGAWTAWESSVAHRRGQPGSDRTIWAGLALVYIVLAQTRLARVLGWLKGLGAWLRLVAKDHHLYAGRRPFQVAATIAIAVLVVALLAIGIASAWDYIKRYRLAIGFAGIAVGFGLIRFISLHEVDAWSRELPWVRDAAELVAAVGASSVAALRLAQLRSEPGAPPADQIGR